MNRRYGRPRREPIIVKRVDAPKSTPDARYIPEGQFTFDYISDENERDKLIKHFQRYQYCPYCEYIIHEQDKRCLPKDEILDVFLFGVHVKWGRMCFFEEKNMVDYAIDIGMLADNFYFPVDPKTP